ncbi:hypothetical protein EYF80_008626 [Liparis tanakae]|uniref:Uncharacterized protein n=1 Tax=Liparis tanakae TaxID=230148 RepID=A0A4Z2ISJ8_9TELE|nr:hypothetical protein EYF80_008626 [Liparis tanakae]
MGGGGGGGRHVLLLCDRPTPQVCEQSDHSAHAAHTPSTGSASNTSAAAADPELLVKLCHTVPPGLSNPDRTGAATADTQVHKKQVEYQLFVCQENSLNIILNDLVRWTKPSPQPRVREPHAGRVIGAFSPVWCTAVVSSFPTSDHITTQKKNSRQRSRTARHNRAAQAEVRTPYPGPRFPGRYCGTL